VAGNPRPLHHRPTGQEKVDRNNHLPPFSSTRRDAEAASGRACGRPFHALRASCKSDLAREYPITTVCKWIGNTVAIAARHYVQVTDADLGRASSAARNLARYTSKLGEEASYKKGERPRFPEENEALRDCTNDHVEAAGTLQRESFQPWYARPISLATWKLRHRGLHRFSRRIPPLWDRVEQVYGTTRSCRRKDVEARRLEPVFSDKCSTPLDGHHDGFRRREELLPPYQATGRVDQAEVLPAPRSHSEGHLHCCRTPARRPRSPAGPRSPYGSRRAPADVMARHPRRSENRQAPVAGLATGVPYPCVWRPPSPFAGTRNT
jgi:hypothetical protein